MTTRDINRAITIGRRVMRVEEAGRRQDVHAHPEWFHREIETSSNRPGESVVVTVGSIPAGTKSIVIPDQVVIEPIVRTYREQTRAVALASFRRISNAEREASASPPPAEFEMFNRSPVSDGDAPVSARVLEVLGTTSPTVTRHDSEASRLRS
jgi:metal-dependent amidase/aminoacylase/carboxypeptidase family protein